MVECPLCKSPIDVEEEELDEGDSVACDECGASLFVANLHPLELEEVEEDDEDPDEEYDEEEEEEEDPWRGSRGY